MGGTWIPLGQLSKGLGDLSPQEEGDAGRGKVGPGDRFGAALWARPRGVKGQRHNSQGTLISKPLYFSFALSEFLPSLRKLIASVSILKQPGFLSFTT